MRYVSNPPNPWLSTQIEWIGEPPAAKLEVLEETATRSIITHNHSPDVGFDYSVNCYRGCPHGCTYCFSRPTHEYLGFGAGTDFERKIVAKVNAPALLGEEFMKRTWKGERLVFSFTSDPYIPLEANYQLTRRCLEVCLEFRNPVSIITKSALVQRDAGLLAELVREADAHVFFTIPCADAETARAIEPFAPLPEARFRAMRTLSEAGVPVGLSISPVIPGLTESQIPELLRRARECGAEKAFYTLLRLPGSVASYFQQRLEEALPERAPKILRRIREMKDGKLNRSGFGERMRGEGEYWEMIRQIFKLHARRLGFNQESEYSRWKNRENTFRRPTAQRSLFDL
ncbi:MAG TPA: PA0069 family radical SAM protein [Blastocatellia bacterium]|nr:PA0069 family radical SAM protein [Blastocatellia bacterium]